MPFYSIIIPTLNEAKNLPNLLTSISRQDLLDFEVIIVDGHSDDQTVEIARQHIDKISNLMIITSEKREISYQRNLGARDTTGKYLLFVDADSVLLPHSLSALQKQLVKNNTDFASTQFYPDQKTIDQLFIVNFAFFVQEILLILHRPVAGGAFMAIKTDVFQKIGGFRIGYTFQDQEISLRLIQAGYHFSWIRKRLFIFSMRRYRLLGFWISMREIVKEIYFLVRFGSTTKTLQWYETGGHVYDQTNTR